MTGLGLVAVMLLLAFTATALLVGHTYDRPASEWKRISRYRAGLVVVSLLFLLSFLSSLTVATVRALT